MTFALFGKIFRWVRHSRAREYATERLIRFKARRGVKAVQTAAERACAVNPTRLAELRAGIGRDPRPFRRRLLILAPPAGGAKGVLLFKFTDLFKYIPFVFDLDKLSRDYVVVVEPSSSGYFEEDILTLIGREIPVLAESPEPVDRAFIETLGENFAVSSLGANCWVDDRVFRPVEGSTKIYDVVMVGIWANVKRHHELFRALARASKKRDFKVALVGEKYEKTLDDVLAQADYYGVRRMLTVFERIPQAELNVIFNQSKVNLVLSRKEVVNKALVEAMFANTPSFFLEGFNFGSHYAHINEHTGGFIPRDGLAEFLCRNRRRRFRRASPAPRMGRRPHVRRQVDGDIAN